MSIDSNGMSWDERNSFVRRQLGQPGRQNTLYVSLMDIPWDIIDNVAVVRTYMLLNMNNTVLHQAINGQRNRTFIQRIGQ
jgi:hypothetical protein